MRNLRHLQHSDRARIEPDLVLTRLGELGLRNIETMIRGLFAGTTSFDAIVMNGLETTLDSGMTVDVSVPATVLQIIWGDDVRAVVEHNDGSDFQVTLDNGEGSDRYDIIEARIAKRNAFQDTMVYKVNATTKSLSPATENRDKEIYLEIQKKNGTAGAGVPLSPTAGSAATVTGTVAIPGTIDLSSSYILQLAIGIDAEFVEIDLRGATPSATTLAEIISAINGAGFGTVASNDGSDKLLITAPGTGENSKIWIKEPVNDDLDCINDVLGLSDGNNYSYEYIGDNPWFKVAEILVPASATNLIADNIKSISSKEFWQSDSSTVKKSYDYESHRDSAEMDHANGSVLPRHLSEELQSKLDFDAAVLENDIDKNKNSIIQLEQENLNQEITLSYLQQKNFVGSEQIIELFQNKNQTNNPIANTYKNAIIMDENKDNNNWDVRSGENPEFKNGKLKPNTLKYMLEEIERYNLDGIGQTYKCSISRYDTTNDCYWMMTNAGSNAIGEIVKLSKNMTDGIVEVIGRWYITAGGASTEWSGIEVDITNQNLIIVLNADGTGGGWGAVEINSDGTLGLKNAVSGSTLTHSTSPDGTDSYDWSAWQSCDANYWPTDVTIWDTNDFAVLAFDDASDPSPGKLIMQARSYLSGNFNAPTATDITGFGYYLSGNTVWTRSLIRNGNDLWIRVNDDTSDYRFIYKFDIPNDIVSNVVIKASGRFKTSIDIDDTAQSNEGITISNDGHILEISSTASYGKIMTKRALDGAVWAENQVRGEVACKTFDSTNVPTLAFGNILVENDRYYWIGDTQVTANEVDVFRYDTQTGTFKHCRLTGASWTDYLGIATDGTNVWWLGRDSSYYYEVYKDTLANVLSAMGDSYNIGNTYDLTTGTLATGIGASNTNALYAICYNADDDILYLLNDTDDKIDTLSTDGATWTQGVYDLPASSGFWIGLTYKNEKIYVGDYTSIAPGHIYVLDKSLSDGTVWYRTHIYQDPSPTFGLNGRGGLDFHGNDLVTFTGSQVKFYKIAVLEDPNVMQLHSFIDSNNIFLSDYVYCQTPITERYFDPEDFADIRDCPDKRYMAVGYGNEGISVLHLDKFLSSQSSAGMPRYNVEDIKVWHFKRSVGGASSSTCNALSYGSDGVTSSIVIEKDVIILSVSISNGTGFDLDVYVIDLKKGDIFGTSQVDVSTGLYDGAISERNDGKGYNLNNNSELFLSDDQVRKLYAHTFTKDDISDYQGENPVTMVAIGTDAGCDVMRIDWDSNNNRTITKIYNNVFSSTTLGQRANFISPFGTLFGGNFAASGDLIYGLKPIWQLDMDGGYAYNNTQKSVLISDLMLSHVVDFSPNSRCWKLSGGTIRHQLIFGTLDSTDLTVLGICDVENQVIEKLYDRDSSNHMINSCDNFEDFIFGYVGSNTNYVHELMIMKKSSFISYVNGSYGLGSWHNGWYAAYGYLFKNNSRPFMFLAGKGTNDGADYEKTIRYSKDFGLLSASSKLHGLQLFHLNNYYDGSIDKTIDFDCDNPEDCNYIESAILPGHQNFKDVSKTSGDISYTDGDSENWSNIGTVQIVTLEDASNIDNASGTFNDPAQPLTKDDGSPLVEGTDYNYDSRLDATGGDDVDIYDDGDSGAFSTDKYLRVVENGTNVSNAGGLNLPIYAKNLATIISPSDVQAYIDPAIGKFVLPRPLYWDKCESIAVETNAEIYEPGNAPILYHWYFGSYVFTTGAMKFNNGIGITPNDGISYSYIKPFGEATKDFNKGTLSVWFKVGGYSPSTILHALAFGSLSNSGYPPPLFAPQAGGWGIKFELEGTNPYLGAYLNYGLTSEDDYLSTLTKDTIYHLYIVWDRSGGLSGGKTLRAFINGTEILSSTNTFDNMSSHNFMVQFSHYNNVPSTFSTLIDNLKIWDRVVTEDPSWEYNGGTGREDALHTIYGSGSGYKPVNLDVGYHYLPDVLAPAKIDEDGVTEGYLEWSGITGYEDIGINFVKGTDAGIAKITLTNTTDSIVVLNGLLVDLYDAGNGEEEDLELLYHISLDKTKTYTLKVEHSGTHNASASGNYYVRIRNFMVYEIYDDAIIEKTLNLWHEDHPGTIHQYSLSDRESLVQSQTFIGNGVTTEFTLAGDNRASDIVEFYTDLGSGYETLSKYDFDLTWGSNSPDYDDNIIDSDGYTTVKFSTAPVDTKDVIIYYKPKSNKFNIGFILKQPQLSGVVQKKKIVRVLDFGLEVK